MSNEPFIAIIVSEQLGATLLINIFYRDGGYTKKNTIHRLNHILALPP
jgi:hypothetical protein